MSTTTDDPNDSNDESDTKFDSGSYGEASFGNVESVI